MAPNFKFLNFKTILAPFLQIFFMSQKVGILPTVTRRDEEQPLISTDAIFAY